MTYDKTQRNKTLYKILPNDQINHNIIKPYFGHIFGINKVKNK